LGEVREKIEARYATALGQAELANTSVQGRMLEVQKSTVDFAGAARLEQIRASIGGPSSSDAKAISGSATPELEAGNGSSAPSETSTTPQTQSTPQPADPA
jgi:phage shock protein A